MTSIRRTRFIKMDHGSPRWVDVPIYFITICAKERGQNHLAGLAGFQILKAIETYHERQRWYCELAVLMPDHVHLMVSFGRTDKYQKIVGGWKRWVTHHCAIQWQKNFFEHRLRKEESLNDKALYLLENPVVQGWCPNRRIGLISGILSEESVARRSTAPSEEQPS